MLRLLLLKPSQEVFLQLKRLNVTHVVSEVEGENELTAVGIDTDGLHVEIYRAVVRLTERYVVAEWSTDVSRFSRASEAV